MESYDAVHRLSALANERRLALLRLLLRAGPDGMAAGDIARALDTAPNTLSAQLSILESASLIAGRRQGRSIRYAADFDGLGALLVHLVEDCCQGRPELCAPLGEVAARAARCADPRAVQA